MNLASSGESTRMRGKSPEVFDAHSHKGLQQGGTELVLKLLGRRLGSITPLQEKTTRKLSLRKIEALGEALLDFTSLADLARWLRKNKS